MISLIYAKIRSKLELTSPAMDFQWCASGQQSLAGYQVDRDNEIGYLR